MVRKCRVGDAEDNQTRLRHKPHRVEAKNVVMACYNMMIPPIVSGLPEAQVEALKLQTKSPLLYSTVGLTNWRAMKEMEIGMD